MNLCVFNIIVHFFELLRIFHTVCDVINWQSSFTAVVFGITRFLATRTFVCRTVKFIFFIMFSAIVFYILYKNRQFLIIRHRNDTVVSRSLRVSVMLIAFSTETFFTLRTPGMTPWYLEVLE